MNRRFFSIPVSVSLALASGCMTARDHQRQAGIPTSDNWTLGTVQKEVRDGMTQGEVAIALGAPNIVSKDAAGQETWIYDKVASEDTYSNSSAAGGFLFFGAAQESGAARQSQKAVTVVIKFDAQSRVASTSYHASQF